ncbi:MAG: translation elongation factor 4 [Candidatus Cloacimonetes bacterium]|nr:translation elongation factor 4 [Candidatus Cloacimonadota bacterium]MBS3767936.1 translation elongation factor 4 [Candidatus Cloacimonadota bacterium]
MNKDNIRNFCIIAHIDHGKSTLADRFLELTHTIEKGEMEQILDDMDLERERGITIKAHPIRMEYEYQDREYILNLIDTPGHVDFSYEVSRSIASCEGALLLIDASQGIEAQTMSNLYIAMEHNLEIIPVINKIDLKAAEVERTRSEIIELMGIPSAEIYEISAKMGTNIEGLLQAIIKDISPPISVQEQTRALIFDSIYNQYRGVIIHVRIFDGELKRGDKIQFCSTGKNFEIEDTGHFGIEMQPCEKLSTGDVGYIIAGVKEVRQAKVGDTVTLAKNPTKTPLPGFKNPKPMVYSGIYPLDKDDYNNLRDALAKFQLNDTSLIYEPETSAVLGFGFRCGFLGMLHLEIFKERLEREYGLAIISTAPSVEFKVHLNNGKEKLIDNPSQLPDPGEIEHIEEPIMDCEILVPPDYIGNIMQLAHDRRGIQKNLETIDEYRVSIHYEFPLLEILYDFYDKLKSVSRGYASFDYSFHGYRASKLKKIDILVNKEKVDAMSFIVHEDKAYTWAKSITEKLKEIIPRHLFSVPIQAADGKRVIARSTIKALRKNVTAKCYGGDITRKRKLLERQKRGKKRMRETGEVNIPQEAFLAVLKVDRS